MKEVLIVLTGIMFFLFGMMKLSNGVQQLFTVRIRDYIKVAVQKPLSGLLVGAVTTVFFQSSSATSVLIIGMVNAGLVTFSQSLAIILGSDIGTTLTVQLVVWKFTDLSPLFIIAGALLWFAGKEKGKTIGELVFFFGLIFFGLSLASYATAPLKNHPDVVSFLKETRSPLIGIGVGILFAGVVQASAIPISILAILAQYNLVTIENALPIVFGANVGTTVTALLASIVASISGKKSALSHLIFKCAGVFISMAIFPFFIDALRILSDSTAQQIALGHLLFNVLIVIVFIFVLAPYTRLMERLIPGKEEVLALWPEYLDEKHLANPEDALNCVKKEIEREIELSQRIFTESLTLREHYEEWKRQSISYIESVVDNLCLEIMSFLCRISQNQLSPEQSRKLFTYTAMVDDIERIADHAVRLAELSKNKYQAMAEYSEMAKEELAGIERMVAESLRDAISLIKQKDEKIIRDVCTREEAIDRAVKVARESHLIRYYCGICHADAGPFFVETLLHLERIADLCHNVAEYVDELGDL